jgi:prevent-host-death family protein
MDTMISIGQVKRDISDLVNRVSYAGERIILTSRGKPKAVLISMEDYQHLLQSRNKVAEVNEWLYRTGSLAEKISERHGPVDVDSLLSSSREDLESR